VPLAIRRRGRKTVVTPDGATGPVPARVRTDPALVKALARAHRWQRMLKEGRDTSISEMAASERIDRGYLGRILQLTLLAPDIVEAIMDGRWLADRGLPRLMELLPLDWGRQRATLGAQLGSTGAGKFCAPRPRRNEPLSVRVAAAERSDAAISVDR
jgi:hypothetical protein